MAIQKRHKLIANIMAVCMFVLFAALIFQMFRIQILGHDKYALMAQSQQMARIEIPARRGPILDRNGNILANSIRVSSVFADPSQVDDKYEYAGKLSKLLDIEASKILKLLQKRKRFVWIKRKISNIEDIGIHRLKLKGVYTRYEYDRLYQNEELMSHVLGITDIDGNGLEGVEYAFDETLQGKNGYVLVGKDGLQRHITNVNSVGVQPSDGLGVMLTIDSEIQKYVEEEIEAVFNEREPLSVTAIVMDVVTGEVLAMANRPTYNPNNFTAFPASSRRNRAITDCYEPGSIIKPLIMASLFSHNLALPDEEIFCHNGVYKMGNRVLHDSHKYGNLSVADVVVKSSNIGMAKLGVRLGKENLYNWLKALKFGRKLGIQLPGEIGGILHPLSSWTSYSVPSISMGHEIAMTPLQFITAFCSIANGGYLLQPTVISAITTNNGKTVIKDMGTPKILASVMSSKVARDMINPILVRVVNEGTGKRARLDEYQLAGKTGTSQKLGAHGYSHTKFIGSFVAYAPADNPKVCVLVMVNEPKGKYYGGTVAAPVVRNILKKTLDYQNGILPTVPQQRMAGLVR
ncbi:MAG: peptidoglycan D,D-transpeptidase FtsI family protein [Candidatus Anammoxibacter sp.]